TNGGILRRLINAGSVTNAALVVLYHQTLVTNIVSGLQVRETNSVVDIGWHHIAANTSSGLPIDTDGDGLADYFEDTDGDGAVDSGETDWQNSGDLGLKV